MVTRHFLPFSFKHLYISHTHTHSQGAERVNRVDFEPLHDDEPQVVLGPGREAAVAWLGGDLPSDLTRLHTSLFGVAATQQSLG